MTCLTEDSTLRPCHNDTDVFDFFAIVTLGLLNGFEKVLDGQVRATHVDSVGAVPEFAGHIPDRIAGRFICDACIGAEDADRLREMVDSLGYGVLDGGFGTDVALKAVEVGVC